MCKGMRITHFSEAICGNLSAFGIVRQIVGNFGGKVLLAPVKGKVFSRHEKIGQFALIIAQKETAAAHDIHAAERDSGLDTLEVRNLKEKTKKAMTMLDQAFDQQFQRMMGNELMDMDVEIQMIEDMMKMEGPL